MNYLSYFRAKGNPKGQQYFSQYLLAPVTTLPAKHRLDKFLRSHLHNSSLRC